MVIKNPKCDVNSRPLNILPSNLASLSLWIKALTPMKAGEINPPSITDKPIATTSKGNLLKTTTKAIKKRDDSEIAAFIVFLTENGFNIFD